MQVRQYRELNVFFEKFCDPAQVVIKRSLPAGKQLYTAYKDKSEQDLNCLFDGLREVRRTGGTRVTRVDDWKHGRASLPPRRFPPRPLPPIRYQTAIV